jgi:dTMP kinase
MKMYGEHKFQGRLFIVEGIDGSGKSTQLALLQKWLDSEGYTVFFSEWNSSLLVKDTTQRGKKKRMLTPMTFSLIHATDFADRLENEMIPALRAGFVVLTDRYIYTLMARSIVRGADPDWIRKVYAFALRPHVVYYLRTQIEHLIPRVFHSTGFDFWESGADLRLGETMYDSFAEYQTRLLKQFDAMTEPFNFEVIDASKSIEQVFEDLQARITSHLE